MIIDIWTYLRGYVTIEVSGFSIERFINLAVNKNIYIWDIEYKGSKVLMKVSIKGYKSLKPVCKKTKCKMKVIDKYGCPFFLFRYRKRKILAIGVFSFVLSLYILSGFIWSINIDGYEYVEYTALKTFLEQENVKIGVFKKSINSEEIEDKILNNFPDISWVNLNINGTKASLSISETLHNKEIPLDSTPSNIIADKNGIISGIVTRTGKANVIKDDVVKEGDILVSGELTVQEDEFGVLKRYVHSDADIYIKKYYDINFDVNKYYSEKVYTGNNKTTYRLNILNQTIGKNDFQNYFKNSIRASTHHQLNLGADYPLPFIIIKDTYNEFELVEKQYSKEELNKLGEAILNNRILREFSVDIDIVDKTFQIIETSSGISVACKITVIEPIGVNYPIINNTKKEIIEEDHQ